MNSVIGEQVKVIRMGQSAIRAFYEALQEKSHSAERADRPIKPTNIVFNGPNSKIEIKLDPTVEPGKVRIVTEIGEFEVGIEELKDESEDYDDLHLSQRGS